MNTEIELKENAGQLMRHATDAAGVCREIVLKTACAIQGKKYVKCEGWMAIATAHGCIASSRDVQKVEGGWRAVGEIRRLSDGILLSQAEGFVGMDEPTWGKRPEYACRAMAQTRAISRACRAAFAHVVILIDSGLSTTPAEEVSDGGFDAKPTTAKPLPPVPVKEQTLDALLQASKAKMLKQLAPFAGDVLRYFVANEIVSDSEETQDAPVAKLFPSVDFNESAADNRARIKGDYERHLAAIQAMVDDQLPGVEVPTAAPEMPEDSPLAPDEIQGVPEAVSAKETKRAGNFRYGIKFGEVWVNTFNKNFADLAEKAKADGAQVRVKFAETKFGKDILEIKIA